MRWKYWTSWEKFSSPKETKDKIKPNYEYWEPWEQFLPAEKALGGKTHAHWRAWEQYLPKEK